MEKINSLFEVETLEDWRVEAGANQVEEIVVEGGASNSNSTNNSSDEP